MMKQDLSNETPLDPIDAAAVTDAVVIPGPEENTTATLSEENTSPVIDEGVIEAVETVAPDADDIAAAVAAAEAASSTIDAVVTAHGDDDVFNNATTAEEDVQPPMEEEEEQQETTNLEIDGAMIAEAAAAAVAAVGDVELTVDPVQLAVDAALAADRHDEDEAAAAAAVAAVSAFETENNNNNAEVEVEVDDADTKKNEQRRKRYREKSVEDEADPPIKKQATTQASHEDQLASRRQKDRQRYAGMTPDQRQVYNAKRRDQYHRQSENSRQRRRERERERYHSLENEDAKTRNTRRAKLERERYQRLDPESLEQKNRKRRERAAGARAKKAIDRNNEGNPIPTAVAQIAPTDDVTAAPTVTDVAPAPVADSAADSTTVTDEVNKAVEENLENSIPKEEQIALAATEVEKAAVEAAVEAVENHHVSV